MWRFSRKAELRSLHEETGVSPRERRWGVCCSEGPRHRVEDRWIVLNDIHPLPPAFDQLPSLNPVCNQSHLDPEGTYGDFEELQSGQGVPLHCLPSYWAIYDGHGGSRCCDYLRQELHKNILRSVASLLWDPEPDQERISAAFARGITQTEQEFKRIAMDTKTGSGSCVIVALEVRGFLFIANLGDSRAVLGRRRNEVLAFYLQSPAQPVKLSSDHKPTKKAERKRIEKLIAEIEKTTGDNLRTPENKIPPIHKGRAFGVLAISRSMGDIPLKIPLPLDQLRLFRSSKALERGSSASGPSSEQEQLQVGEECGERGDKEKEKESERDQRDEGAETPSEENTTNLGKWASLLIIPEVVCAEPEMRVHRVEERDWFLILASDGLWDVCNSLYAVDVVANMLRKGLQVESIAQALVREARKRGSRDDITVIIVELAFCTMLNKKIA